eukprot:GHUV01015757.1.p1 GENE.GHUV01015757.1~~GHUV01015757.1.p1  ORF type:complete len:373 (+),score=114.43 GHUV01015757.1:743-1861(+)
MASPSLILLTETLETHQMCSGSGPQQASVASRYCCTPATNMQSNFLVLYLQVKGYLKALPDAANFIATADSMAVALWQLLPQETPRNELWAGWTRILRVSPRKWRQLLKLELRYEHAHDEAAKAWGSYYYLSFIGSRPEARGKGYGSLLLSHITHRADAEGRWCMLEATSERSQALYARHGFITYESYRPSKKAPPVFLMKRAPQAPVALASMSSTPLSAAALRLLQNNKGCISGASSPGSECGYSTKSSLISAVVRGHEAGDSDTDSDSGVSDIEEGWESSDSELQQKCEATAAPADAGVIIRSNSSVQNQKDKTVATSSDDGLAAAAAAWTLASQSGATVAAVDGKQQQLESSSNPAGAGGPTDAAAGSA